MGKILLDAVPLIAAANDKVRHAVGTENLHDMPQNGLAANFDHGLGAQMGFLRNPRASMTAFMEAASPKHSAFQYMEKAACPMPVFGHKKRRCKKATSP